MKRPLGIIGLVYLCVTAVVFYFYSPFLVAAVCIGSAVLAAGTVIIKLIRRDSGMYRYGIAIGASAVFATLSIFLYSNYFVNPIISNYSDKEIYVEGYVCEELSFNHQYTTCIIQTDKINGEAQSAKISLTLRDSEDLSPFERVSAVLTPSSSTYNYQLSRKIFLNAFQDDRTEIHALGEKHHSPYAAAVAARGAMKRNLEATLGNRAAPLAKAVLLGDKKALDNDVQNAFTQTGTSYLIVVSGMHLAAVTLVLRKALRRSPLREWMIALIVSAFTIAFAAITGFAPSVTRAAIMLIIYCLGRVVFRDADGINSLGIAALILTVPNPYIVGDVGMLLSFTATFGIVLWADKITYAVVNVLRLNMTKPLRCNRKFKKMTVYWLKRAARWFVSLICVSLTASLWVMPLSVLMFESITPLTVVISFFAYPLTALILILSMPLAMLGRLPFLQFIFIPLSAIINLLADWLIESVTYFSKLPLARITADKSFYFVWLAVTACLVAAGYVFKGKKLYVFAAVAVSVLTLSIGGAVEYLSFDNSFEFFLLSSGKGYTAAVINDEHISLISCGGKSTDEAVIIEEISKRHRVDNIIIPSKNKENVRYLPDICNQFDVSNILVYDNSKDAALSKDKTLFSNNTAFTLSLGNGVSVRVYTVNKRVYQRIASGETSVLIIPDNARISDLPPDMLSADYAVLTGEAENIGLLDCGRLIATDNNINSDKAFDVLESGKSFRTALK